MHVDRDGQRESKRNLRTSNLADLAHKELLTLEDVAVLCGVSKRTVEYAVGRGELSSVKSFGGRRVTRAQLDAYIRGLEIRAGFRRPKVA